MLRMRDTREIIVISMQAKANGIVGCNFYDSTAEAQK